MRFFKHFTRTRPDITGSGFSHSRDCIEALNQLAQGIQLEIEAHACLNPVGDVRQLIKIITLGQLYNSCERLVYLLKARSGTGLYVASSLFLHRCYHKLIEHDVEHLFYVTGIRIGNLYTLDQICEFKVESASMVHAAGDIQSTHMTLINLDNFGHQLHGLFHKHPGTGIGATMPSSTDLHTQTRMEKGGYPALGAVFSEDGFIRFFTGKKDFEVKVYGEGVNHVEDKVFKIDKVG